MSGGKNPYLTKHGLSQQAKTIFYILETTRYFDATQCFKACVVYAGDGRTYQSDKEG